MFTRSRNCAPPVVADLVGFPNKLAQKTRRTAISFTVGGKPMSNSHPGIHLPGEKVSSRWNSWCSAYPIWPACSVIESRNGQ